MNLVETCVSNITSDEEVEEVKGLHKITADFDCYGRKEIQTTKYLTALDYKSVLEKGYYLT